MRVNTSKYGFVLNEGQLLNGGGFEGLGPCANTRRIHKNSDGALKAKAHGAHMLLKFYPPKEALKRFGERISRCTP
jgi:hypothetical protein